jgi:hypothetical protein
MLMLESHHKRKRATLLQELPFFFIHCSFDRLITIVVIFVAIVGTEVVALVTETTSTTVSTAAITAAVAVAFVTVTTAIAAATSVTTTVAAAAIAAATTVATAAAAAVTAAATAVATATTVTATATAVATATTVAAAATAVATATTVAAAAATKTTSSTAATFTWFGFLTYYRVTVKVCFVQCINCGLRLIVVWHLNEAEASGFARVVVHDNFCGINFPKSFECFSQVFTRCPEIEFCNKNVHLKKIKE